MVIFIQILIENSVNNEDTDQTPNFTVSDLGLHYLLSYVP